MFNPSKPRKPKDEERVEHPLKRVVSTHIYCCICNNIQNIVVSRTMQDDIKFIHLNIPVGNRCCKHHLIKNKLYQEKLRNVRTYSNTSCIGVTELTYIILWTIWLWIASPPYLNVSKMLHCQEKQLQVFTLNWKQLNELTDMLQMMSNSGVRKKVQAIVFFFNLSFEAATATKWLRWYSD